MTKKSAWAKPATNDKLVAKHALDGNGCPNHEVLRDAIISAVESGSIPAELLHSTHLTMERIAEFFEQHQRYLNLPGGITYATKLPFNTLQVAFVLARSCLKQRAVDKDVLDKKARNREDMKKAIMLFKQQRSSGMDTKKIMESICEVLKNDSKSEFKKSTAISAPSPVSQSTNRVGTMMASSPWPNAKPVQKSQLTVEPEGKYRADESNFSLVGSESIDAKDESIPNSGFNWHSSSPLHARGQDLDAIDGLTPPLELHFPDAPEQVAPITSCSPTTGPSVSKSSKKPGKRFGSIREKGSCSMMGGKKTNLSDDMRGASINDAATDTLSPTSPEKRQKGARGVAINKGSARTML